MNIGVKVLRFIKDKKYRFFILLKRNILFWMSDRAVLSKKYELIFGHKLDLYKPCTFNEKMQWLKLNYRLPAFTNMVDKYEAKIIVSEMIGSKYCIPTLGIYNKFDDIDFNLLPNQFVIKCTHDCGSVIIVKDKKSLDLHAVKKKINKALRRNYFYGSREWPYKNVKPRIIIEKFMKNGISNQLEVFKIFCFNGEPYLIQTIQNDKLENESIDYFDTEWNLLDLRQNYPNSKIPLAKPKKLNEMLEISSILSKGLPFIRIDLYSINSDIYFSEFTFYSDAGEERFYPETWDLILGEKILLPNQSGK